MAFIWVALVGCLSISLAFFGEMIHEEKHIPQILSLSNSLLSVKTVRSCSPDGSFHVYLVSENAGCIFVVYTRQGNVGVPPRLHYNLSLIHLV